MTKLDQLAESLQTVLADTLVSVTQACHEVTAECAVADVLNVLQDLRDNAAFAFDQLIDLCAVDYLQYGFYDFQTDSATESGFSRATQAQECEVARWTKPRFAVVYHLLSTQKNHRLRLKVFIEESDMRVPSAHSIWKGANWFEREAYDLFGVLFEGHPDLRRILTDYGFIGHPFRKDFPLSGHVEMRYDAAMNKVIYEPVDIEPRILVPKVIRKDNRYHGHQEGTA